MLWHGMGRHAWDVCQCELGAIISACLGLLNVTQLDLPADGTADARHGNRERETTRAAARHRQIAEHQRERVDRLDCSVLSGLRLAGGAPEAGGVPRLVASST